MPEQLTDSEHWMYVWAAYGVTFAILAGLFLHSIIGARRNERQLNALREAHSSDSKSRDTTAKSAAKNTDG